MRIRNIPLTFFVALMGSALQGQEPPPVPDRETRAADLERLIHDAVASRLGKVVEDASGWGRTIPLPEQLKRPQARRMIVDVDGHPEVPDGTWHKVRLWLADPERDLRVRVKSFRRLEATKYRLETSTDAALRTEADVVRWRNGILLADLTARARVSLNVSLGCEVSGRLDISVLPPELRLDPDLRELKIDVTEVVPTRVTLNRLGVTVGGEVLEAAGDELRDTLQALIRRREPELKKRAAEMMAKTLREGKGPLAAARMLQAAKPLLESQEGPGGK
jgi:hypothetical protein